MILTVCLNFHTKFSYVNEFVNMPNCQSYFYKETVINYTGEKQELMLIRGVHIFHLWGASGSGAVSSIYGAEGVPGKGGYVRGIIHIQHLTRVYVFVGGRGGNTQDVCSPEQYQSFDGAWNGGGGLYTSGIGGIGGGATDIRFENDDADSRVLVAGGGGGAAFGSIGGDGGYPNGTDGSSVADKVHERCLGTGGTQYEGGSQKECSTGNCIEGVGSPLIYNKNGEKALGGFGIGKICGGSSGGGGYYGGGGTYNSGGAGGGSSYVSPFFTSFSYQNGINNGDGKVIIQSIEYNSLCLSIKTKYSFLSCLLNSYPFIIS